ncbi:MAG TPA: hypothetical protein VK249_08920 [Anaerolineales bacterium]|nr:hypothetical protein [Anaerolineales bacterium]
MGRWRWHRNAYVTLLRYPKACSQERVSGKALAVFIAYLCLAVIILMILAVLSLYVQQDTMRDWGLWAYVLVSVGLFAFGFWKSRKQKSQTSAAIPPPVEKTPETEASPSST